MFTVLITNDSNLYYISEIVYWLILLHLRMDPMGQYNWLAARHQRPNGPYPFMQRLKQTI